MLHLHAREVVVPLYKNKDPVRAMAPAPLHMQERLYACGWQGEIFTLVDERLRFLATTNATEHYY